MRLGLVRVLMVAVLLAGMVAPVTHAAGTPGTVVINEICPGTGSAAKWVELYNTTDSAIDISSWRLVRGSSNFATVFASGTVLASHGFILRESTTSSLPLNGGTTPLRLLTAASGTEIDTASWPALVQGQSYARTTDGGNEWGIVAAPTPNATNVVAVVPPPVVPPVETPPVVVPDPPPIVPPIVTPPAPPVEETPPALPPTIPPPVPEVVSPVDAQPQYPAIREVTVEPPLQPGKGSVGTATQMVASVQTSQNLGVVVVAMVRPPAGEAAVTLARLPLNEPEDEADGGDLAVETSQPPVDEAEKTPAASEPTDCFGVRWYWWFLAMLAAIGAVRFIRIHQKRGMDAAQ